MDTTFESVHNQPYNGTENEEKQINKNLHWKPWGTRSPVIIAFILASLVLAAVVEVLAQKSLASGVLSPSSSINDIPDSARLAALYVPTVIAVLYGFFFSCIDLDVKRVQPWIELSKPGGALAENSLLLDYDFDFLPFVPLRAARRRHWPVFYSGIIIVIIFWVITPLQSAIFGTGTAELTQPAVLTTSGGLIPIEDQASLLDASVLNGAFATLWLNQTYPKSLTAQSATLPIQAVDIPLSASSANWTGWTWQLTTELKCWPALLRNGTTPYFGKNQTGVLLDNGQGCTVPKSFGFNMDGDGTPYVIRYIGWYDNARLDYHMASTTCDERFKHQFLAITSNIIGLYNDVTSEVTAQFCEPSYYKQNVTIPMSGTTLKPDFSAITNAGPKTELTDTEFNRTAFEYLLGTGVASVNRERDYPDKQTLEGYYQVKSRDEDIPWPIETMPSFAIGSGNWTGKDLLDPANQASAYAKAHQAAFSIAISELLAESSSATQQGSIDFRISGIVVSRPISATVEILLAISGLLAGIILLYNWNAQTNLPGDTSSIARIMEISQHNEELLQKFIPFEQSSEKELKKGLGQLRFESQRIGTEAHLSCIPASPEAPTPDNVLRDSLAARSQMTGVRPTALKVRVAILVILLLAAGVSILAYLKYREVILGGLERPSQSFEVLQILENYIPTAFATFLDPFWVLVNRIFCLIQPFRTLQKGNATARRSIECDYTGLMPQFNIIRAARSNHYFLAMICAVALLGNILAVGLGGIFDEREVDMEYTVQYQPQRSLSPTKDRVELPSGTLQMAVKYSDHLQLVRTNLSAHTSLPPWTTPEAYFLPFADILNSSTTTDLQRANTTGIVFEPRCSVVSTDNTSSEDYIHFVYNNTHSQLYLNHVFQNESSIRCGVMSGTFEQTDVSAVNITGKQDRPRGPSSNEIYSVMQALSEDGLQTTDADDEFCGRMILAGWVRINATSQGVPLDEPESSFMMCSPRVSTAPYQVTVDSQGYVIDSQRLGDLVDAEPIFANRTSLIFYYLFFDTIWGLDSWHNTTVANDWMNSLLKLSLDGTAHVDPNQPLVSMETMLPAFEAVLREGIASLFGLNPSFWKATGPDVALVNGVVIRSETRIFMSEAAFAVSESILVIYIIVALLVYTRGLGVALPRLPTTIGSVVAYIAGGRAVRNYIKDHAETAEKVEHDKQEYRYGTYVGQDGKMHVGIELEPYSQLSTIRRRTISPPSQGNFRPFV
ncbi:hypothetical protein PFICI_10946 [Pestalotiopsis fici W106-1]|uniref:Uncharacterized protein n=1 Tax=Pestalotiopsis fici (strain W106-1 / CGMCC3.15140) TaxID=1229662 RepID=W3WV94_PESFW|nr:uncharacterized protein PFICI_10946 [Pestalotiopsis fici W106-1]ETS77072.1 hypothetical protein PFICI_10946 [Pestalotiopsis fici W106-1]